MGDLLSGIGVVLASSWRASPSRLTTSATLMLIGSVSGPAVAVFLALMTDAVMAGQVSDAMLAAAAVALVALLSLTMEHFAHIFFFELSDLHHIRLEREIGALLQGSVGTEQHERQDYADRMELLRSETRTIGDGVQTVLTAITLLVQIGLTTALLAHVQPWLLLLPVFALPPLLASRLAETRRERAEIATAETTRLGWHLLDLAVSPAAAKEVRLFGLQQVLRQRQRNLRLDVERQLRKAELASLGLRLIGQLLFALGYVAAVVLVVRSAITGEQSVGDVIMVVTLAVQTNTQAAGAVAVAKAIQRNARAIGWLRWLRAEAANTAPTGEGDQSPPTVLSTGIDFTGVSFRYPGTDRDVLTEVTMRIPAGSTVAIVGDNGAGKSTLVKLLCRFYQPTNGQITVDGVDLRRIDPKQWRQRMAAGFQDFVHLEMAAWESIGVGDLARVQDRVVIGTAVRRADAQTVIDRLPDGLDSQLGTAYADGEELSGGQWQRVALSRAMMRDDPLLLILDEPTSALDPLTEHALFERYNDAARHARERTGGITVLVSHRFSTVRMADVILVISKGGIVESGDHRTLMSLDGLYAEMFRLQAAAYR